jgi:predicted nucleotidyltransferase
MNISEQLKNEILNIIFKHINKNNCLIFLFGSYACNKVKQSSDIDIGIISKSVISLDNLLKIKEDLNENTSTLRNIDLVDFGQNLEKDFIKIALERIEIWHKTKELEAVLNNFKKH